MVKREDALKTNQGRVRDTDRQSVQPGSSVENSRETDKVDDLLEGRYKPEMGTIIIRDYSPARGES